MKDDNVDHIGTSQSSEKSFGVVFSVVFLIVAIYPLIDSSEFNLWALFVSIVFMLLAYFLPQTLRIPNKIWFKLGILIGRIVSPIVMSIIYFCVVFPTGIIMRILRKDPLNRKLDRNTDSYWVSRVDSLSSMKDQF